MANFVFNISKGRAAEFYRNVKSNTPSGCKLVVALLKTSGLESQATLEDVATFTALLAGATDEANDASYARKTIVAAALATADDGVSDNIVNLDIADQTWTALAGGAISSLVVGYDPVGSGTNSDIIPISHHDFAVTPDSSDVTAVIHASGFYTAT